MATLEEEIKQKKFQSEYHKAVVNILFTSSWLYNLHAMFLKNFDLSPEQFNVLRILRGGAPKAMRLIDVSSRMLDRNSNATRLVEKLRQKNLVKRELCATDRRQVDIVITDKGMNLLSKIDARQHELFGIAKGITRAEATELNRILDKLRN